jgi:hypothetical protein
MLSPNISKTPEGYLACHNVPLCRSGYQDYLGKELEGFDGYEKSWDLDPNKLYKVFRPKESVLDPEFARSLDGKTVVDEHPDGNVVHVENDGELNCGQVHRIRQGPDQDGEVTLLGDLLIKNPELIEKVKPEHDPDNEFGQAIREVSVGYTLKLKRLDDGTIVMMRLRGNHVAVVPKGRAGPRIAIKDSAPPEIKKKEPIMSLRNTILGRGIEAVFGKEVTPEEKASIIKDLETDKSPAIAVAVDKKVEPGETAADAEMTAAKACMDKFMAAKKAGDKTAMDAAREEMKKFTGDAEEEHAGDSVEDLEDETANDKEEKKEETANDGVEAEKEIDDPGESVLKAANDSVRDFVRSTRPVVAEISRRPRNKRTAIEQTMVDNYNGAVKSLNALKGQRNSYSGLAHVKRPAKIEGVATDSTAVTTVVASCNCFDGVPYRAGMAKHQSTCLSKGAK